MNAILELTEARVKVHIERQQTLITAMTAELDKELPTFKSLEQEFFAWKSKIDAKLADIQLEKDELNQLIHFDKFKHNPKPRLTHGLGSEPVQQQIVRKKKQFKDTDIVPLPYIKWRTIIGQQLRSFGRFVGYKEMHKSLIDSGAIDGSAISRKRFYSAAATMNDVWFLHEKKLGLIEWSENGVPKAQYLNDFLKQAV